MDYLARPTADTSTGAWTPSTGSVLYAMLDEETASDTDYISTTSPSAYTFALGPVADPIPHPGKFASGEYD